MELTFNISKRKYPVGERLRTEWEGKLLAFVKSA